MADHTDLGEAHQLAAALYVGAKLLADRKTREMGENKVVDLDDYRQASAAKLTRSVLAQVFEEG